MKINRDQLVKAFETWNRDYLAKPDEYCDITQPKTDAELQADHLIKLLKDKYDIIGGKDNGR